MKNLMVRTLSGLVLVAVFVGAVLGSQWSFGALLLLILVGGQTEFYKLARETGLSPQRWMGLAVGVLLFALNFIVFRQFSRSVTDEAGGELGILNDVSLTISDNRFVVITGPNGGGKTTLAKVIMGLVTPTGGQILFNGQDITHLGITERARLGISYGFQQPPRFKGITVRNLLTIASGDANLSKDKCCKYLTQVGLCANDYLDREVDVSLSGGEVKRIEIATLLARGSELMIFDEPEAGIDLWSFARLTETFEQLRQRELATMIIISHQERIIQLADEIVVVGGGELKHRGSTEEIFPLIMADTLGSCPVLNK